MAALAVVAAGIDYALHHFDPIRVVYKRWKAPDRYLYEEVDPRLLTIDPATLIDRDVVQDPGAVRRRLIELVWEGDGYPLELAPQSVETDTQDNSLGRLPDGVRIDKLRFELALGLHSTLYYVRPAQRNNKLVLYHHGFGDPIDRVSGFLGALLDAGYDVLAINALGQAGSRVVAPPNRPGAAPEDPVSGRSNVFHHPTHFLKPLHFHLDPIIGGLQYALAKHDYESVDMAGFSIGGFFTVLTAAIEPRIERSYPIAGDYPVYMRRGQEILPGAVPYYPPLLAAANHLELYVLGASGLGRSQMQIFNRFDRCCYNGLRGKVYEGTVRDAAAATPEGGRFLVVIDETHADHRISKFAAGAILSDLALGR